MCTAKATQLSLYATRSSPTRKNKTRKPFCIKVISLFALWHLSLISLQSHGCPDIWTQGSDLDTNTHIEVSPDNHLLENEKPLIIALLLLRQNKIILQRQKELFSSTGFTLVHLSETADEEDAGYRFILQIKHMVTFSVPLLFISKSESSEEKKPPRTKW